MSVAFRLAVTAALSLMLVARVCAQEHEHAGARGEQLGKVVFATSCRPEAQTRFEHAMALLHSFWWEEGSRAFRAVAVADSTCALAYWGLALNSWGNPFAGGPSGDNLRRGAAAAVLGGAIGAPTAREQGFLAAGVATASPTDTTFSRQRQAAAILNPLFRRFPTHPGLAHYIIHANDSPQLASLGLDAARRYAQIAPSAPHAQHMPSHIFVRLGLWDETIAANQRSFDAGLGYARAQRLGGVVPEQFHALDYMVYGYLQEGRDSAARRTVAQGLALATVGASDALVASYNRVAMEARVPLERGDWAAAAGLPVRAAGQGGVAEALAHFARGIGAARSMDTAQARVETAALAGIERGSPASRATIGPAWSVPRGRPWRRGRSSRRAIPAARCARPRQRPTSRTSPPSTP